MTVDTEYEGRILAIDIAQMEKAILEAGGKHKDNYFFKRYVFDTVPYMKGRWIRLRTDGYKTTLTLKQIRDDSISGTDEWEVTVSDFDTTRRILEMSGLASKGYQENRRTEFLLGGALICIDEWPLIPPYLEIEAGSAAQVKAAAKKLGLDTRKLTGKNTDKIYSHYDIDLNNISILKFPD